MKTANACRAVGAALKLILEAVRMHRLHARGFREVMFRVILAVGSKKRARGASMHDTGRG
jgi:hypothetical protein